MFNDNIGLVFSGGGAKGSYQIGAWKALRELGIDKCVHAVAAASIGGFNSALFVQGDLKLAEDIWSNITITDIFKMNDFICIKDFIKKLTGQDMSEKDIESYSDEGGILSKEYIYDSMEKYLDYDKISSSPITCIETCCEIPSFNLEYIKINGKSLDDVKNILLATSAYPVAYSPVSINDDLYIDGGLIDNFPIKPLYDLGYRRIIIITCKNSYTYDRDDFPDADITAICPSEDFGGTIKGTFNFINDTIKYRMQLGYEDAMSVLTKYK